MRAKNEKFETEVLLSNLLTVPGPGDSVSRGTCGEYLSTWMRMLYRTM